MTTQCRTELRGFKLLLAKAYFDKGYGLTNYFFKVLLLFGLTTQAVKATFYTLGVYSVACYIIGRLWYKYKFIDTENEISNIFNPFQREMRKAMKTKRFI